MIKSSLEIVDWIYDIFDNNMGIIIILQTSWRRAFGYLLDGDISSLNICQIEFAWRIAA